MRQRENEAPAANGNDRQRELVERVVRVLESHADGPLTLGALSAAVGASPYHLQRTFKRWMGVTPRQYADALRLDGFKARLRKGQDVTRALYEAGYGSSSRLYERAPARLGMTPGTYRRGGRGMHIVFTTAASPLGRLLVARTERGICAVRVGDSDRRLEAALRREYPEAGVRRDRNGLHHWVRTLLRHLEGRQSRLDLPLDVRGTAFQCHVWEELRRIPYGRTRSYSEVARAIGKPAAVRAVARACATNPVPLVIPCHRVIQADGGLGGYGLGLHRKRALLEQEKQRSRRALNKV
ncbi:MAG: methylated-DNA--[protein]-cysteine S-methyltransferase [Acidobacteria bacterium]|nr:methylated-DNA--[protein]-cysteine S-methyltransferase [Acidobacteriota bacterium]